MSIPFRCVDGLFEALSQIYNDQESSNVLRLTQKVAAVFGEGNRFADGVELEELKQLRADAQASLDPICCSRGGTAAMLPHGQLQIVSQLLLEAPGDLFQRCGGG